MFTYLKNFTLNRGVGTDYPDSKHAIDVFGGVRIRPQVIIRDAREFEFLLTRVDRQIGPDLLSYPVYMVTSKYPITEVIPENGYHARLVTPQRQPGGLFVNSPTRALFIKSGAHLCGLYICVDPVGDGDMDFLINANLGVENT